MSNYLSFNEFKTHVHLINNKIKDVINIIQGGDVITSLTPINIIKSCRINNNANVVYYEYSQLLVYKLQKNIQYDIYVKQQSNTYTQVYAFSNTADINVSDQLIQASEIKAESIYNRHYTIESNYEYIVICVDINTEATIFGNVMRSGLLSKINTITKDVSTINKKIENYYNIDNSWNTYLNGYLTRTIIETEDTENCIHKLSLPINTTQLKITCGHKILSDNNNVVIFYKTNIFSEENIVKVVKLNDYSKEENYNYLIDVPEEARIALIYNNNIIQPNPSISVITMDTSTINYILDNINKFLFGGIIYNVVNPINIYEHYRIAETGYVYNYENNKILVYKINNNNTLTVLKQSNNYTIPYSFSSINQDITKLPILNNKDNLKKGYVNNATYFINDDAYLYVCVDLNSNAEVVNIFNNDGCIKNIENLFIQLQQQLSLIETLDVNIKSLTDITNNINIDINGKTIIDELKIESIFTNYYFNLSSASIGDTYYRDSPSKLDGTNCLKIEVQHNDKYILKGKGINQYIGLYCLTDKNDKVINVKKEFDARTNPVELNIEKDGYLYVNFGNYDETIDSIFRYRPRQEGGLKQDINQLNNKINEVDNKIDSIIPSLKLTMPSVIYATVGTELILWNDNISLPVDKGLHSPINYIIKWNCPKGINITRGYKFLPTIADVGTINCSVELYNLEYSLIDEKEFSIIVSDNTITKPTNICYFGDSLGAQAALQLYNNFNNSKAFKGIQPTMLGTFGPDEYHYDAVGGYDWSSYATRGRVGFRIFVSNLETSPKIGDIYKDENQSAFSVSEINITDGTGNIQLIQSSIKYGTLIMPSGTLSKYSGVGPNIINYTDAYQESANPLWNIDTNSLDIHKYKTEHLHLQESTKIDAVIFQLGVNGTSNTDIELQYIKTLYEAFIKDNSNCLFIIGLPTEPGTDIDGTITNGGASYDWIGQCKKIYNKKLAYISLENNVKFPNIRISSSGLVIDRYYGYGFSSRKVSARVDIDEVYHNNYVHPITRGYQQIADAQFATLINLLQ